MIVALMTQLYGVYWFVLVVVDSSSLERSTQTLGVQVPVRKIVAVFLPPPTFILILSVKSDAPNVVGFICPSPVTACSADPCSKKE